MKQPAFSPSLIEDAMLGARNRRPTPISQAHILPSETKSLLNDTLNRSGAQFLVHAAVYESTLAKVGYEPLKLEDLKIVSRPCPTESKAIIGSAARVMLNQIMKAFEDGSLGEQTRNLYLRYLHDWLELCNKHDKRIPDELTARVMLTFIPEKQIHQKLAPCLGERFLWLQSLDNQLRQAYRQKPPLTLEQCLKILEEGQPQERVEAFATARSIDKITANEKILELWPQENTQTRLAWLEVMERNLESADEDLLENYALKDGRKEVRLKACAMLGSLSDSAYCLRMFQRFQALISLSPSKQFTFHFLEERGKDKEALRDGLLDLALANQSGSTLLSANANWFYQIAQHVKPSHWQEHLGLKAEQVLRQCLNDETWSQCLTMSIFASLSKFKNREFEEALLEFDDLPLMESQQGQRLLQCLDQDIAEAILSKRIPAKKNFLLNTITPAVAAPKLDVWRLVYHAAFPWSKEFSTKIVEFIEKELTENIPVLGYSFDGALLTIALNIHPLLCHPIACPEGANLDSVSRRALERFNEIVGFRQEIYRAFAPDTPG